MADEPSPDTAQDAADDTVVKGPAPEQPAADAGTQATPNPAEGVNQGATGTRPLGETPLSVETDKDAFAERPEAFVGAAFAGGLALALVLRRLAR
jgi:hypothetical protein